MSAFLTYVESHNVTRAIPIDQITEIVQTRDGRTVIAQKATHGDVPLPNRISIESLEVLVGRLNAIKAGESVPHPSLPEGDEPAVSVGPEGMLVSNLPPAPAELPGEGVPDDGPVEHDDATLDELTRP